MIGLTACTAPETPSIRHHPGPIAEMAESDAVARIAIDSELDRDPMLRNESIKASVYKGQATLVGFAQTHEAKERAGEIAARVNGVSRVNNSVFVMAAPSEGLAAPRSN